MLARMPRWLADSNLRPVPGVLRRMPRRMADSRTRDHAGGAGDHAWGSDDHAALIG